MPELDNDQKKRDLTALASGDLIDVKITAECGGLSWICCLADPMILAAAALLLEKYNGHQRRLVLSMVCGCAAPVRTPQLPEVRTGTPVMGPPIEPPPVITPPEDVPADPPAEVVACPDDVPPPYYFTQGIGGNTNGDV
jgi:hypothetical protein